MCEEAERFKARAADKGVQLEVRSTGELPVRGDRERTGQILAVLLDNAVKCTPSGGRVTVEGRQLGRWTEARVTDTGPGIAPEHLPRVFDRFYKIEAARTRGAGGGTGLGLAIARELARAQKGDLEAESAVDRGAVFRLRLPRQ